MKDIDPSEIEKLRKKPSYFVEKVLGVEPYEYQKEIIDDPDERKAVVGGRQIGKTTMMAWMALHEFAMYANRKILLIAPTQRQALNFMRKLKMEIQDWVKDKESQDEYGLEYVSKSKIEGANGSWIEALPALEETIRGYTIHSAYVDESAFIERKIFTSIISPMMATTNGQFVLASTAWGKDGYLYNKFDDDEFWNNYRIASMQNPDIPPRQIQEWQKDMTQMEYEREVLGQFSDKKNAFFKNRDVNSCLEWAKKKDAPDNIVFPDQTTRNCFMGVDPATTGDDQAVLTSVDENGNVFDIEIIERCEIPELEREIERKINSNARNYLEILIEENGIGEGTVHRFEKKYRAVEGFRTTIRSKESVYNECKNQMQEGNISIPDHESLKRQIRSIEYEQTQRGNLKIHAPEGESDDLADSYVFSVGAMTGKDFTERATQAFTFGENYDIPEDVERKSYTF